MTASKTILLARGLQRITANHLRANQVLKPMTRALLTALNCDMAKIFHRIEYNILLSEASALDPRFKKRAFSDEQSASDTVQRLTHAAAQVIISSPTAHQGEGEAEVAEAGPMQDSLVWSDFDEQVSGLVSQGSASAEAILEFRSYTQEALLPRSSNPLTWWKSRSAIYPRLTHLMKHRLCVTATSVPSERVSSKMGEIISERRSRIKPSKVRQLMFLNANLA